MFMYNINFNKYIKYIAYTFASIIKHRVPITYIFLRENSS